MHTKSDRPKDTVAPQRKHHHPNRIAKTKSHSRFSLAQEWRRNLAAAPPFSNRVGRTTTTDRVASLPLSEHTARRWEVNLLSCYNVDEPTPETLTLAPAEFQSLVDHNKIAENVSEHRRARDLNSHLPKRILDIHFAQYNAGPATESLAQIHDTPGNIAHYVPEITRWSRQTVGVFVYSCHWRAAREP